MDCIRIHEERVVEYRFDFVAYIQSFIGAPYVYGGDGSGRCCGGFDCSGLVVEALKAAGWLPNGSDYTASGLRTELTKMDWCEVVSECAERGDVVFYGTKNKVSHVAICIGDLKVVEAAGGDSKDKSASVSRGFVRVRPYNYRNDIVCVLRAYK